MRLERAVFNLAVFGLITAFGLLMSYFILPMIFAKWFDPDRWNIGKNILFISFILLVITILNFIFGQYLGSQVDEANRLAQTGQNGLYMWFFMTFTVGVFPLALIIYITERALFRKYSKIASELQGRLPSPGLKREVSRISLDLGRNNNIEISTDEFICAQAEGGNYLSVFWSAEDKLNQELVRMTLQEVLDLFAKAKNIVRCHKSYVVNLDKISNYEGNARSLVLQIEGLDFAIPVSRTFPREQLVIQD